MEVSTSINLKSARNVVACGGGVRSEADFRLIEELAECLGAAVAGTRPAVDRGFISSEQMIGQTGVSVRPELYIAVGVSGSWQHRTGMEESATIIAINSDPDAPIFSIADYSIIGDLHEVVGEMIKAIRDGKSIKQFVESSAVRSRSER